MNTIRARTDPRLALTLALLGAASLVNIPVPTAGRGPQAHAAAQTDAARRPRAASSAWPAAPVTTEQAREAYGRVELGFEANRGQTDESVNFLARGAGYTIFLKPTEAVFVLSRRGGAAAQGSPGQSSAARAREASRAREGDAPAAARREPPKVLRMKVVGARDAATVEGADELEGRVNYFLGSDPSKWRAGVPTYGRVRYAEVYPGVDLVYYGNQRQLEYDFVVAPGRETSAVKLRFDGADRVETDAAGDLLLTLGDAVVRQPKPFVYQEVGGARREVSGGYAIDSRGQVGFRVGEYDRALPLVIDPVLVYSTYLGGGGTDEGRDIAVDSAGNAYICGYTQSTNFPRANAFQSANDFLRDAFVTKINAAGTALVYSTYLGGNDQDFCLGVAVDAAGSAYVAGITGSTNFPTANAFQSTKGGPLGQGNTFSDAFVTKLNPAGSALVYSTYLGGRGNDGADDIALDSAGNAYVTGSNSLGDFPVVNPIQATANVNSLEAFLTKFNAAGSALVYSTYLGGNNNDHGHGVAVDPSGNAYVVGFTGSTTFPTANALQPTLAGSDDAFVTKVNANGTAFVYSTYLGGAQQESGHDIAVDSAGNAYLTGMTFSYDFPRANGAQPTKADGVWQDAFVTKLNANGSALVYSTYLGGTGTEIGRAIALDSANNAYVTGFTTSPDTFPTAVGLQCVRGGDSDAFLTKVNPSGSFFVYSTHLGGGGTEQGHGVAVDASGNAYVVGDTTSTNLPTVNPIQSANAGTTDAFVLKLSAAPAATTCSNPTPTQLTFRFSAAAYAVDEGAGSVAVTVERAGPNQSPATVDFATAPDSALLRCDATGGVASERCDFTTRIATLRFAAGETQKTVRVFVTDDVYVEGNETFRVSLSAPTGGPALDAPAAATVQIADNDSPPGAANPAYAPPFFVRMHYIDFLNREGEPAGFQGWVNSLTACQPPRADCDHVMVSSSFFRSVEFFMKGYYVIRFYKVSLGTNPDYRDFTRDSQRVTADTDAEVLAARDAFANEWVGRADFKAIYDPLSNQGYVDRLEQTAGVTLQNKAQLVAALDAQSRTRAQVLKEVVESAEVAQRMYNDAFVSMQYFGYLRRDPEPAGFNAWLAYLNQNPQDFRTMVGGFVNSLEYRLRFGPSN